VPPAPVEPRRFAVVDVHEHAETQADVERLLAAAADLGIARVCVLAAPRYTFEHRPDQGFDGFEANNEMLLEAKKKHPDRVCAFVTIDPRRDGNAALLEDYVARGADGLKLFLGHGGSTGTEPFHSMPLDDERMMPVYELCERTELPITYHVNLAKYEEELVRVLDRFPRLWVSLPHFGLYRGRLRRLGDLLDRHERLFVDVSFGARAFHVDGFEALAEDRARAGAFLEKYAGRVLFGSDLVVTSRMSDDYLRATLESYLSILEAPQFRFFLGPGDPMYGLHLSPDALRRIYESSPAAFLRDR
jgi:predicted TIM-barrel fold metal-dependent hydrolase